LQAPHNLVGGLPPVSFGPALPFAEHDQALKGPLPHLHARGEQFGIPFQIGWLGWVIGCGIGDMGWSQLLVWAPAPAPSSLKRTSRSPAQPWCIHRPKADYPPPRPRGRNACWNRLPREVYSVERRKFCGQRGFGVVCQCFAHLWRGLVRTRGPHCTRSAAVSCIKATSTARTSPE
jgi:hypothetical protein